MTQLLDELQGIAILRVASTHCTVRCPPAAVGDDLQAPVWSRGLDADEHAWPPVRHRDYNHDLSDYQEKFPIYVRIS